MSRKGKGVFVYVITFVVCIPLFFVAVNEDSMALVGIALVLCGTGLTVGDRFLYQKGDR